MTRAGDADMSTTTRAGHASMSTTQTYLHLASVVFPDQARRLEERFGAEVGNELGTRLREAQEI